MHVASPLRCISSKKKKKKEIREKKEKKINNHKGTRDTIEGMYLSEGSAAG